jgi:chemotaxis protein methyltransferase CheR
VLTPSDHEVELSEEEFRLLRDFIHERFGLYFDDLQRASLRARLLSRVQALDLPSFEDYYHYLRFGPQRTEEMARMVSHLTNNETYFFREQAQLKVLAEHVLRGLKERKAQSGERTLKVLSAGCSTGEEALTTAMLIHDSGQFFWGWDVQVVGMDVDRAALEKARKGVYFHNSFRGVSPALVERHFVREGTAAHAKDGIKRLTRFVEGNILDPASYPELRPLDVVLCRNVLIYFSDATTERAVTLFYDILRPGGYLLLGHAESLSRITNVFLPIRFPGAMVYQKPPVGGAQ